MKDPHIVKPGSFEEKILQKCNGKRSISDIANIIGKSTEYVGSVISRLNQKGLIKNIKNGRKNIPKKI